MLCEYREIVNCQTPARKGHKEFHSWEKCDGRFSKRCSQKHDFSQNVKLTGFIIWLVFVADITGGLIGQLQGIINNLITDSEVVTEKSRGLRVSRNDRTVEVIKLFIIWLTKRF